MKKTLIAIASFAFVGAALAQSSVTIFGTADAAFQHVRQAGVSNNRLVSGSNIPSRLGFSGSEDLGGGLSARFWMEGTIGLDAGNGGVTSLNNQANVNSGALVFDRRSTVSLASATLGELRLGRDYTPSFWNLTFFDPYNTVGVGSSRNISQNANFGNTAVLGGGATAVRASNSIGYLLPASLGGVYGQVMYAMGENASNVAAPLGKDDGNYRGIRLGYAAGPLDIAGAAGKVKYRAGDLTASNFGASYTFSFAKLMGQLFYDKSGAVGGVGTRGFLLGAVIPVGASDIKLSYTSGEETSGANRKASQLAVGYVYNLSKRSAIYTTYAALHNKNGAAISPGGVPGVANATWSGLDVGIRHSF